MKRILVLMCIVLALSVCVTAFAEGVDDMLSGKQDLVILGSVKDIDGELVTVTVDHVLSRPANELVGKDINIAKFAYTYCIEHSTSDFRNPIISDNVVISLNKDGDIYTLANSAYKVDSNEYANCRIVVSQTLQEEDCIRDMQRATCYIRADGMVREFDFDSDGRIYAVYPQSADQCVSVVDEDGTEISPGTTSDNIPTATLPQNEEVPTHNTYRGMLALIIVLLGAVLGFGVSYVLTVTKAKKNQ